MREPERKTWHQKIFFRVIALSLLPLIVGGLYLISTRIMMTRPTPFPVEQNNSIPER